MRTAIGHYAPWFLSVVMGGLIVMTLSPSVFSAVPWWVLLALIPLAIVAGGYILDHNRRLCERCITAMPLDPSTAAARYGLRFRVAHLFERKVFAIGYLATVLVAMLVYDHPVGRYGCAVVQASLVYLMLVYITHQRLQPWCPYCRGGGEEQSAPTAPTPISTGA
jgi:hypothetical protein